MPHAFIPFAGQNERPAAQSPFRRRWRGAFTVVELLVVLGIIAVIMAIVLPVMSRARAAGRSVTCLSNLRQLSLAFHLFAERNHGHLPDPSITNLSWESSLLPYTQANAFGCPADGELLPTLGSSYDWRDTADPQTTLAGKDILGPHRASLVLVFESLPGWHVKGQINAAMMDGSARPMSNEQCLRDLDRANELP